jgi:hypothetical protein
MKNAISVLSCLLTATSAVSGSSSLRGVVISQSVEANIIALRDAPKTTPSSTADVIVDSPDNTIATATIPDFNCFATAWSATNAEQSCETSKATDGSACVWCSAQEDTMGACLSTSEATAADGQFGLKCPKSGVDDEEEGVRDVQQLSVKESKQQQQHKILEVSEQTGEVIKQPPLPYNIQSGIPDMNCFKAAWIATNAKSACGTSQAADGSACVWCSVQGDVAGACLSGEEAGMADGQFGLKCSGVVYDEEEFEEMEKEMEEESGVEALVIM